MKTMKLLLTAMMAVAIVALSVGCPQIATRPAPIVETPTVTLPEGQSAVWMDFAKNITITSATTTVDAFYYTTNGTIPTTKSKKISRNSGNSTVGTVKWLLDSANTNKADTSFTLKIMAMKKNHLNSAVAEMTFSEEGTVATPTITPDGGVFTENFKVALTCVTPESKIYYSLDNIDPTDGSTLYTEPFTVTAPVTVKAIAYRETYDSSVASAEFTLAQLEKPVILPENRSFGAPIMVSFTFPEGAAVIYSITTADPALTYSAPFEITDTTTVTAIAKKQGYADSEVATATFTREGTPRITFTGTADSFDYSTDITFDNGGEEAAYRYTIDGTTTPSSGSDLAENDKINLKTLNAPNPCTVKVIAIRKDGSLSSITEQKFTKRLELKQVVIDKDTAGLDFDGSADVTLTSPDDAAITYKIGTGDVQDYVKGKPFRVGSELAINGTVKITAYAKKDGLADAPEATATYTKKKLMKTVLVEAGTFTANEGWKTYSGTNQGLTNTEVKLTKNYYMGVYEVTRGQYAAVITTVPGDSGKTGEHPVESLTWFEAVNFCNEMSVADGFDAYYAIDKTQNATDSTKWVVTVVGTPNGYRLPTEAEWEYAARGGKNTAEHALAYAGSNTIDEVAWYEDNSSTSKVVGLLNPNALGIYDMSGNVAEMCNDFFSNKKYPVGTGAPITDPTGVDSSTNFVRRGGTFDAVKAGLAGNDTVVAWRGNVTVSSTGSFQVGFRVVRTAP